MLGAVKGDPQTEYIPLFRLLARRWVPLAPVLRERVITLSSPRDEPRRRPRRSKRPRAIYANENIEQKISKRAWNPWLWIR
jgi:hypothetical protein